MAGRIFSPGKLLLTSEYFVLDGALALAVPTKPGQDFSFSETDDDKSEITWEAHHQNKLWLKAKINYSSWTILETNIPDAAGFILKVLHNVQRLSLTKFQNGKSYQLQTNLEFPADFGLGSSSTLMNILAEWAEIDAFELNEICLGGSGYDIAIAKEKSSILYQISNGKRITERISFKPEYRKELIFVHLNRKQDSREAINHYKQKEKPEELIKEFSELTEKILKTNSLVDFENLMEFHEQKLGNFLEITPVKEKYFKDCPVFVKSLGAWGGDFVMSAKFEGYRKYFTERGYNSIFKWNELILE